MQGKTDLCVTLSVQVKNVLVDYLRGLDASLLDQEDTVNINNVLEIIEALTQPDENDSENKSIFSYLALPFTFAGSLLMSIPKGLYHTLYKQLTPSRKEQLRYIAQQLTKIEQSYQLIAHCDTAMKVSEVESGLLKEVPEFISVLQWLCDHKERDRYTFSNPDAFSDLPGLQHNLTGSSQLATLLKDKVLSVIDADALLESIQQTCQSEREKMTLMEKNATQRDQAYQLVKAFAQKMVEQRMRAELEKVQVEKKVNELQSKNSALMEKSLFAVGKASEYQRQLAIEHFVSARLQRTTLYDRYRQQLLCSRNEKQVGAALLAAKKDDVHAILKLIDHALEVDASEFEPYFSSDDKRKNNSASNLLRLAKRHNLQTMFELMRARIEASFTMKFLSKTQPGSVALQKLKRFLWLQNVVEIVLDPSKDHGEFVRKIKEKKEAELDFSQNVLSGLAEKEYDSETQIEAYFAGELAGFLRQCLDYVRIVRLSPEKMILPFAEEMIFKQLSKVLEGTAQELEREIHENESSVKNSVC